MHDPCNPLLSSSCHAWPGQPIRSWSRGCFSGPIRAADAPAKAALSATVSKLVRSRSRTSGPFRPSAPCWPRWCRPSSASASARGQGSGVIISEDGYVLTAGHVSGKPGQTASSSSPTARSSRARRSASNKRHRQRHDQDHRRRASGPSSRWASRPTSRRASGASPSATPAASSPAAPPSSASAASSIASQHRDPHRLHPGRRRLRRPALRHGGQGHRHPQPHRRQPITDNIHVPVDTYRETWDRLVKGESWGGQVGERPTNAPYMGVQIDLEVRAQGVRGGG